MKVAVQIDPIERINFKSDSTISLVREALKRGYEVWFYYPQDLFLNNEFVGSFCRKISSVETVKFIASCGQTKSLLGFDVVLMRHDPPVDMGYLTSTYILDKIKDKVLILNNPQAVRDCSEKLFALTKFPEFMPPTLITEKFENAEIFLDAHGEVILKPLYGCAGQDVIKVSKKDLNKFQKNFEYILNKHKASVMLQKYLHEINQGDKRVLIVNGEVECAINRIPAEGSVAANMAAGGKAEKTNITKKEMEICKAVATELKRFGIIFAGLDIIGGYLTEINVTSPTGIEAANGLYELVGKDRIESKIWDALECILENSKK